MAEITNIDEARQQKIEETAKEIADSKKGLNNPEVKQALTEASASLKENLGLDIPEEIILEVGTLFTLPDDKFAIIADEFISSFEKSLNNSNDKISLAQALNISNVKLEDLIVLTEQWNHVVDEELKETLSEVKRDFLKKIFFTMINIINDTEGVAKRIIAVPFEKITEDAITPTYAHPGDAGADVYVLEEITLKPGEVTIVKTGLKVALPKGYELQVRPRSGLSAKSKLRICNTPGTIDSGYRGEIGIICENAAAAIEDISYHFDDLGHPVIDSIVTGKDITIEKGQKIAQLVLSEVPTANYVQVKSVDSDTDRAEGGFGSTGD